MKILGCGLGLLGRAEVAAGGGFTTLLYAILREDHVHGKLEHVLNHPGK